MKYRVERERTDSGFGPSWVVLEPTGIVVITRTTWLDAYRAAHYVAVNLGWGVA